MNLTRRHLLFVDDEPAVRTTLSAILRRYGFAVTVAGTLADALAEIRSRPFDLLLCDLNIEKEGDGYELIRAMRDANPRCVTIVLTGYPAVESAIEGIRLGIDDYILKPASADTLVALLAEKLAARQLRARILSISGDEILLRMRHLILEKEGYAVTSALGLQSGLEHAKEGGFDLLVLGHSITHEEKEKLVTAFREVSQAPIISLRRKAGDQSVNGAEYHIEPDPDPLLKLISEIVRRQAAAAP